MLSNYHVCLLKPSIARCHAQVPIEEPAHQYAAGNLPPRRSFLFISGVQSIMFRARGSAAAKEESDEADLRQKGCGAGPALVAAKYGRQQQAAL